MKKILLIGAAVVVVAILGMAAYYFLIESKKSPAKTAGISNAGIDINITYCAPSKRGRLIFGDEKDKALQPYGKYWRLGANAATEITFNKNVDFAGKPVNAGTYRMYAVPGASTWQVALNSELDKWGAGEPDHAKDVVSVEVPAGTAPAETEQFVINLTGDSTGVQMDFMWDKVLVRVPVKGQ